MREDNVGSYTFCQWFSNDFSSFSCLRCSPAADDPSSSSHRHSTLETNLVFRDWFTYCISFTHDDSFLHQRLRFSVILMTMMMATSPFNSSSPSECILHFLPCFPKLTLWTQRNESVMKICYNNDCHYLTSLATHNCHLQNALHTLLWRSHHNCSHMNDIITVDQRTVRNSEYLLSIQIESRSEYTWLLLSLTWSKMAELSLSTDLVCDVLWHCLSLSGIVNHWFLTSFKPVFRSSRTRL